MIPYTKRRTGKLPNARRLEFYEARDSHGSVAQSYTLKTSQGDFLRLWTNNQYLMGKPEELKQLLKEVTWDSTTHI